MFVRVFQVLILNVVYFLFARNNKITNKVWVVGVDEIASMVASISGALPNSISVCLNPAKYYSFEYTYALRASNIAIFSAIKRGIIGPAILGYLASKVHGVIYVGKSGFLFDYLDDREYEFNWLRRRKKLIVCYFTGSDIRSTKLMLQFESDTGLKTLGSRIAHLMPITNTDEYDDIKKSIAFNANKYAAEIYNARVDQMSYLRPDTKPFRYFYPDNQFNFLPSKFDDFESPVVVHAPSSPYLKGTEQVRIAVNDLLSRGYNFKYVELIDVEHSEIIKALATAHIVINEFYSFVPGVFGVEAMANTCALVTSADEKIEKDLPKGSNNAWEQTYPEAIKDNLEKLLNDRAYTKELAIKGFNWAQQWASASSSGSDLRNDLAHLQDHEHSQIFE